MMMSDCQPTGENAAAGEFDPLNFFDAWASPQCFERFLGRPRVEVQHTDRMSTGVLRCTTDGHLPDIDTVFTKTVPTRPMIPGTS